MKCWCGSPVDLVNSSLDGMGPLVEYCTGSRFHNPMDVEPTQPPRKLYVSGPMSGIKDNNYPAFNHAAAELRAAGFEVVNPAEYGGEGPSYREILKEDIRQLTRCDGVALLPGWERSKGALAEVHVAAVTQMKITTFQEWIDLKILEDSASKQ